MSNSIKNYIINIVLIVLVLITSFSLWNKLSKSVIAQEINDDDLGVIMDMTDYSYGSTDTSVLTKTIKLALRNQSRNVKNYDLYIKTICLEELDVDDIEIYLDDKLIDLNNPIKDGSSYSFKLQSSIIKPYTNRNLQVTISFKSEEHQNLNFQFFLK